MAIFSLIYPFFVIQALQSRPPSASLLPGTGTGTPGSGASTPTKETHSFHNPILGGSSTPAASRVHVPIFFFARHALKGLRWLADAGARERGGGSHERALGRRY
jgi:etoposide-induced 2.4 mRNA